MNNTINNYEDLQNLLNTFVSVNNLTPGGAPHGVFWETLDYEQFITGDVPNLGVKILVIGDSANSSIIQALQGTLAGFPYMPAPSPPYNAKSPTQDDVISQISAWIDANCPN
jgi:hypothetical protein